MAGVHAAVSVSKNYAPPPQVFSWSPSNATEKSQWYLSFLVSIQNLGQNLAKEVKSWGDGVTKDHQQHNDNNNKHLQNH